MNKKGEYNYAWYERYISNKSSNTGDNMWLVNKFHSIFYYLFYTGITIPITNKIIPTKRDTAKVLRQ